MVGYTRGLATFRPYTACVHVCARARACVECAHRRAPYVDACTGAGQQAKGGTGSLLGCRGRWGRVPGCAARARVPPQALQGHSAPRSFSESVRALNPFEVIQGPMPRPPGA